MNPIYFHWILPASYVDIILERSVSKHWKGKTRNLAGGVGLDLNLNPTPRYGSRPTPRHAVWVCTHTIRKGKNTGRSTDLWEEGDSIVRTAVRAFTLATRTAGSLPDAQKFFRECSKDSLKEFQKHFSTQLSKNNLSDNPVKHQVTHFL